MMRMCSMMVGVVGMGLSKGKGGCSSCSGWMLEGKR